jgi:PEP-CTERM motif-containing protein
MSKLFKRLLFVLALTVLPATYAHATILFDGFVTNNATCGGSCFGLTYELIITDASDADATTYTGQIKITGTYVGPETFIAAVDFKPDSNTITAASLVSGPGLANGGDWTTAFNTNQAAQNCDPSQAPTGFICSFDTGNNNAAPTGANLNYSWLWNFSMTGTLAPGHLGVRFNNATDTDNGNIISASTFDNGSPGAPTGKIPEPSALLLLGSGLVVLSGVARRFNHK